MGKFASFWFGGALSAYEFTCIKSFIDLDHEYHLYTYEKDLLVPEGCVVKSAADIYAQDRIFFYMGGGKISAYSNMFRYRLVFETGVCWVDTDVICMDKCFGNGPEYIFARQDDEFFNAAVLKFPKGHEAMRLGAEYCWEVKESARWGDLGPRLFTKMVREYDLSDKAQPTNAIYPVHWSEAMSLLDPKACEEISEKVSRAGVLHLWNEIWSRNGVDKTELPPKGSFMARIVEQCRTQGYFTKLHSLVAPSECLHVARETL